KEKDLERDVLQFQHMTATAQPPRTQVKLVAFAEPDRLLHSSRLGSHGTPMEAEEFYATSETTTQVQTPLVSRATQSTTRDTLSDMDNNVHSARMPITTE